ncbi:zf-TFIIB domain-containing protein [bacterium]|nr:zf-TFIIB domain-containing protein [bacterium]
MKCPDCQGELKQIDCKGIMIDECIKCKGKWFDRDELQKAKDRADDDLRWLDFDPFGEDAKKLSTFSQGKICPKCFGIMLALKYMDSQVLIDKCSGCKGVWLESGELAKIILYLENKVNTKTEKEYVKDTFRQFIEIFTGQEGLISEVKDFLVVFYLLRLRIAVEHPNLVKASDKTYETVPWL